MKNPNIDFVIVAATINQAGRTGVVLQSGSKAAEGFSRTCYTVPKGQPVMHLQRICRQFTGLISCLRESQRRCLKCSFV